MKNDHNTPRVTVEDLLRLKKAERPDSEFWHQFEREMRVKQLAAIVEPRPWWAPFIRIGSRLARYQLPVGATAILALTFLTVQEYQFTSTETDTQLTPQSVVSTTVNEQTAPTPAVASAESPSVENSSETIAAESSAMVASQNREGAPAAVEAIPETQPESTYSPAAEAIAANLAAVEAKTPELARLIARVSGVDEIINPRTPTKVVDPLARVQAPSDSRRASRLLATALPVNYSSNQKSRGGLTRVDRGLTEDRVYDSISRIGLKADSVAIRF